MVFSVFTLFIDSDAGVCSFKYAGHSLCPHNSHMVLDRLFFCFASAVFDVVVVLMSVLHVYSP